MPCLPAFCSCSFSEAAEKRPDMSLDYQFEDTPLLGVQARALPP